MDGNKQERKRLIMKHKTFKWVKTNNAYPNGSPSWVPVVERMTLTLLSQLQLLKKKENSNA
jgi:hypothetical protein